MQIQQIRNATLRITYSNKLIITDPYLADKHTMPSYTGASPNPLVDLPCTQQEVIADIDMALVSHIHSDHFDPTAQGLLPKEIPLFCQAGDEPFIEAKGFRNVMPVINMVEWEGINIIRTPAQHGTGDVLDEMGNTSGFLLQSKNEPTVYWVGDSIWCEAVADVINCHQPDIIITHSCGAVWGDKVLIVMDAVQTIAVCRAIPKAVVVATHMESLDHATVSRSDLRNLAETEGIKSDQLFIPEDGETINF
ncbi:MBL fold metallo-hydrolase [Desulfobacterales bacterium HSG17]|nr:MBL fold metallo-hydrolase [Desulfobacterales bacterium HSG17]